MRNGDVIVVLPERLHATSKASEGPAGDPHQLLAAFSVVPLAFVTPQPETLPANAFFWKIGIAVVTRAPVALPMATLLLTSATFPCRSKPMPSGWRSRCRRLCCSRGAHRSHPA